MADLGGFLLKMSIIHSWAQLSASSNEKNIVKADKMNEKKSPMSTNRATSMKKRVCSSILDGIFTNFANDFFRTHFTAAGRSVSD